MPDESIASLLADLIPPTAVIRRRLAVAATETGLLRALLKLAVKRDREAERLAGQQETNHAR